MPVKLYSYWRSSCSWRVRIALALKEVNYEYSPVHLVTNGGEQRTDEYRSLNPMKQVPSLILEGKTVTQSMAIVEFLDEKFPKQGVRLFPEDLTTKTKVREVCEIINSGIQPIQNLSVLQQFDDQEKRMEWGHLFIDRGFVALEAFLKTTAGKYCVGDVLTAADAFLVPQVGNALRFKVDMSKFPIIAKIDEELKTHKAFIAAHPTKQPDCPENSG
uniref:probable maleylacetoacetate isomerase 2 n=1 Tax=Styela clava TaxID=7725 RepID=UPI001939D6B5|nr:probable maleylacetoacetate isomerase 2 [Styela clava]